MRPSMSARSAAFCVYEPSVRWKAASPSAAATASPRSSASSCARSDAPASRAASIASHFDIERIAWPRARSGSRRPRGSRGRAGAARRRRACGCAPTSRRPRPTGPGAARLEQPEASRLERASRRTVRETPSCSASSRSVGSRSPAASRPCRICELIASVAASTSEPSRRPGAGRRPCGRPMEPGSQSEGDVELDPAARDDLLVDLCHALLEDVRDLCHLGRREDERRSERRVVR